MRREEEIQRYPIRVEAQNLIANPAGMTSYIYQVEVRDAAFSGEGDLITEVGAGESFQFWVDFEVSFSDVSVFNPWTICITAASADGLISEFRRLTLTVTTQRAKLSVPAQPEGIQMPNKAETVNIYVWGHPDLRLDTPDRNLWYSGG